MIDTSWHSLDLPSDLGDHQLVRTQAAGTDLVAVRHAGEWRVFADTCTHAQCAFSEFGEIDEDGILICNCHGAEFSLQTGEVLLEPAEEPLTFLPLRVRGGRVEVDLG